MAVKLDAYLSPYNSEQNLGKTGNPPSYRGCGISTDWHATAFATLGESSVTGDGSPKRKREMARDLKRGWAAFKAQPDFNGIPDTGDLIRIHDGMFPGLPDPSQFWTTEWDDVMDIWKGRDHAISIAVRLSVLPQDQMVDPYTRADHQVLLVPDGKDGRTRIYGPMKPHSLSYRGHFGPLKEVRQAAKAIEDGQILTWLYPIGQWTRERLTAKRLNKVHDAEMEAKNARIKRLRAELEACEIAEDCDPVVKAAIDEAFTDSIAASSAAIGALRET